MSKQRDLEKKRASHAWKCIQNIKEEIFKDEPNKQKEYGSLARSAPADIQTSGLGQTLAFWQAKGYENGKPKDGGRNSHYQLLEHIKTWLKDPDSLGLQTDNLVNWVSENANINDYRRATTEAIAFLAWLKRFAEAELP